MTLAEILESCLVNDKTMITIKDPDPVFGMRRRCGNWYADNILEFKDRKVKGLRYMWNSNEVIVVLEEVEKDAGDTEGIASVPRTDGCPAGVERLVR